MLKISISCFFVFGLVCCFAGGCGVALVNWFQWWSVNLAAQWILFMSSVNHSSNGGLVRSFLGSEGMWRGKSYVKLVEVKEGRFWRVGRSQVHVFLLVRMCGVWLEFDSTQLGTKIPLDLFFSWTWCLIFCCAKNVRKEIGGLVFVS
jgi:hypothetical protein